MHNRYLFLIPFISNVPMKKFQDNGIGIHLWNESATKEKNFFDDMEEESWLHSTEHLLILGPYTPVYSTD